MSDGVDLSEFLSAFVTEADEHLGAAGKALLLADADLKSGKASPRAVRDLFRALHTLKGLAGMIGVDAIVAIAHRMEHCLRLADRAGGRISLPAVELLLTGVRAIEARVRELAEGRAATPAPSGLLDALDALDAFETSSPPPPAVPPARLALEAALADKLSPGEREQLSEGLLSGRRALRVDFSPSPARAATGLTINAVREALAAISEIVAVIPTIVPRSAAAPGGLTFAILVVTHAADEAIVAATGLPGPAIVALAPPSAPIVLESLEESSPPPPRPGEPGGGPPPSQRSAPRSLEPTAHELPEDRDPHPTGVLRVELPRVERAMDDLSSLIVTRFRLDQRVAELTAAGAPTRALQQVMGELARQLRDLRGALIRVRMVRMAEVLERVPLIVRSLRRATGKSVRLSIDVAGAELDKAVAERVFPALVHLVRNAVDHGIEGPAERRQLGKPDEGVIRIGCSAFSRTQLELTVSDDGRGIDATRLAGKHHRDVPGSDAALLDLLCEPGLSSRDAVSTTSGRGMGLDIARGIVVGELGGELQVASVVGGGTTFTVRVPLTIAVIDAFAFEAAGQRFVAPVAVVEEILEIDPAALCRGPSWGGARRACAIMQRRGEAVPVVDLEVALGGEARAPAGATRKAIVIRRGGQPIAFAVDRMLGQKEAVVRPLRDPLVQVRGVAGATDLGDGKPTLVLDLVALATLAAAPAHAEAPS